MAVATPPSASQELRLDTISASATGRPLPIDTDLTVVGDVTTLHAMTQDDVIDKVIFSLWNSKNSAVTVSFVVNPVDDTVLGDVNDATIEVRVAANSIIESLPVYVRRIVGNSYTIAAYVPTADLDVVLITGRYIRYTQGSLTA
jgi:hypothetical protein